MKGFPYLDGVTIDITPDAAARLAVLRAGKAELPHVWGWISPEEARSLKQTNAEMSITPYRVIGQGFIYMRTDQPPFNDVRVRRAVSLAIDRKSWNDALLFGEGCVDAGPVPCALTDWKLDAAKMEPARAKYAVGYDPAERPSACSRRPATPRASPCRSITGRATRCRGATTTSWPRRTWARSASPSS
jgi:ABC-type transport system substrate-binding protein